MIRVVRPIRIRTVLCFCVFELHHADPLCCGPILEIPLWHPRTSSSHLVYSSNRLLYTRRLVTKQSVGAGAMPSPTRKLQAGLLLLSAVAAASDSVPTTTRGRVAFIAGLPTGTSLHPGRCSAKAGQPSRGRILRMGALPPDDSPYAKPEEERPFWGTDYVPKEGHVGSMPPGTRLEDKPMEELAPVSNIPYPHFQEWPFHYR